MSSEDLLPITLAVAVPLALSDLAERGGPSEADWLWAQGLAQQIAESEALLFVTPGTTGRLFASLAGALAIMAYAPGGIRAFGHHWQAVTAEQEEEA